TQFACFRIDDRELLFDSQSECMLLHAMAGGNVPQKCEDVMRSATKELHEGLVSRARLNTFLGCFLIVLRTGRLREQTCQALCQTFSGSWLCYETGWGIFVSIKDCRDNSCSRPRICSRLRGLCYRTRLGNLGLLPFADIACGMGGWPMVGIFC